MQRFLVGGAVRDALLGRVVTERDWVVVGETPESMLAQGFKPVGKDFPVFLHPETHEEYALARTERKTAPGYRGFQVDASSAVTLADDLLRRDLTVNAMARTEQGELIDPYGGARDLEQRLLRHVSPAFAEDPVRILRVARFAARYAPLGFRVADETLAIMRAMTLAGEVDALVPERVWAELVRALAEPRPSCFVTVLRDCGALARLFPEIERLFGVPQPPQYHPEIDTGLHILLVVDMAAKLGFDATVGFAALTHDLGKALTPPEQWPRHRGHEDLGVPALDAFCERLRVPNAFRKLAEKVMRYHGFAHRAFELRSATMVDLFYNLDLYRQPEQFAPFLQACEADCRGRTGFEERAYPQASYLQRTFEASATVAARTLVAAGYSGEDLGRRLREARIAAVRECRRELAPESSP